MVDGVLPGADKAFGVITHSMTVRRSNHPESIRAASYEMWCDDLAAVAKLAKASQNDHTDRRSCAAEAPDT